MATSPKQIRANRENASKSTGPRTAEGKARSSQNAITHGLTAKQFVIDGEDPEEFAALFEGLVEDYGPKTKFELYLVEQVAGVLWRLRRIPACEAAIYEIYREIADVGTREFDPHEFLRTPYDPKKDHLHHLAARFGITEEMAREEHERQRVRVAEEYGIDLEEFDKTPPPSTEQVAEKLARKALRTLGHALLKDASESDVLGKLARHEAHLVNTLERLARMLERHREHYAKISNGTSEVIDLVSDTTAG